MTTDIASLGLDIDTKRMRAAVRDIEAFQKKMGDIETAATKVERQFGKLGQAAVGVGLGIAAAFSVQKVIEYGDAWQQATNQLRLATDGIEELKRAQQGVFEISQKTFSSIDATAQLASKINQYVGNLTGGLEGTLSLVETINKASAIGGTAAASQAAGLFQLNQALASGTLRGEELNSVMEQTPIIARAIADGLGLTIGQMRKVAAQGKITSELVVKAMQDQKDEIDAAFASLVPTVSNSLVKLQGAITRIIGEAGAPMFQSIAQGISDLSDALASDGALKAAAAAVQSLMDALAGLASIIPAVVAGLATMMIVKQLAPAFVAIELALAGAEGRALVFNRATQLMTAGMVSARAATTGLVTALGGPLGVALGLAAGAFVLFANKAEEESKRALTSVSDAVNHARSLYAQLDDKNAEVRKAASEGIASQLRDTAKAYADAINRMDDLQSRLAKLQSSPNADNLVGQIKKTTLDLETQKGTVEELRKQWAALREEQNSRVKPNEDTTKEKVVDPYGLLGGADKEAQRRLKRINDFFVDLGIKIREAQKDRDALLASIEDARGMAGFALATNKTTEALDHQLDVLDQTAALLNGPMALAYKQMGDKAQATARSDAERLVTARALVDAIRAQLKIQTDLNRLPRLASALAVSADEYELTQLTFELLDQGVALTEESARAEAAKVQAIRKTTEELDRQAARARELAEAPAQNWLRGIENASDDFWTNFAEKGFSAFDDLGDAFKHMWNQLQADILKQMFEPFLNEVKRKIGITVSTPIQIPGLGNGQGAGAGGGGLPGVGGIPGIPGGGAGAPGGAAGATSALSSIFATAAYASAIYEAGAGLATSIVKVAGKKLSADSMDRTSTIGGLFGGIIGGLYGLIFGSKPSDQGARVLLSGSGSVTGVEGGKRTAETENAAREAARAVAEGQKFLKQLGATLGQTVDSLLIGTRDQARYSLTGDPRDISVGTVGDPADLANDALNAVLRAANFTNPILDSVADAMLAAGKSFEDTLGVLGDLNDILPDTEEPLSKWGEALKKLNETFADLRESTDGLANAALDAAQAQAKAALRDDFNEAISDALMQAREPLKKELNDLLKDQMQRIADATSLGGDMADVLALNAEELADFIEKAATSADVFSDLTEQFAALREQAAGLGGDVAALDAAFQKAREQIVASFDTSISDQLDKLSNPTLAALKQMLDGQKARLDQAKALGANITAVERLNALETQRFFEGLNDEQFRALGDYLGIVEDFTGKIGLTLVRLRDEIDDQINSFDERRDALNKQQDAWRSGAQALLDLKTELLDRYSDLSPQASLDDLRRRFGRLTEDARAGNESAIAALPSVAQQLIERSRDLFGSTKDFRNDLEGVTKILDEIGTFGLGKADSIATQLETLEQQRDLLIEIRDILNQPNPDFTALSDALGRLAEGNDGVEDLLKQYLELTAAAAAGRLPNGQIANAALAAATTPGAAPPPSTYTPLPVPGTTVERSTTTPSTPPPAASGNAADNLTADAIAELIAVTRQTAIKNSRDLQDLRHEFRVLAEQVSLSA